MPRQTRSTLNKLQKSREWRCNTCHTTGKPPLPPLCFRDHSQASVVTKQQQRPWSTMECSQPAAWTTNRRLLMAPSVNAIQGRLTNVGTTLPRTAHRDSGVIGCHQCLHITLRKCSGMRPTPLGFVPHAYQPPPPSPHPSNH